MQQSFPGTAVRHFPATTRFVTLARKTAGLLFALQPARALQTARSAGSRHHPTPQQANEKTQTAHASQREPGS